MRARVSVDITGEVAECIRKTIGDGTHDAVRRCRDGIRAEFGIDLTHEDVVRFAEKDEQKKAGREEEQFFNLPVYRFCACGGVRR